MVDTNVHRGHGDPMAEMGSEMKSWKVKGDRKSEDKARKFHGRRSGHLRSWEGSEHSREGRDGRLLRKRQGRDGEHCGNKGRTFRAGPRASSFYA